MPILACDVERRDTILCLEINVSASFNQPIRDGGMPTNGREVEGCAEEWGICLGFHQEQFRTLSSRVEQRMNPQRMGLQVLCTTCTTEFESLCF